jgi:beta-phosphoglucomutase-like phosphatase (HAD superfamily)
MRLVLFDLGHTLETNDQLLPGAKETLTAVSALTDPEGGAVVLALLSDFDSTSQPGNLAAARQEYADILDALGIRSFFVPLEQRTTLSVEVGAAKPAPATFRAAADKVAAGFPFHHVMFITENPVHIQAARLLGMAAIHVKGPGQAHGEVDRLVDLVPLIGRWVQFAPCGKKHGEAVGRHPSQANKSKRTDPGIKGLTAQVDTNRLRHTITHLAGLGTRWSYAPTIGQVPEWVHGQFVARGYPAATSVRYQPFNLLGSGSQQNVLCSHGPGGRGIILVCCHYDSISENAAVKAPGADDNGSGLAAVLELARVLQPVVLQRQVLFAAFGGEEQGLFGSSACAEVAGQEGWPIDVVINLDMVAYNPNPGQGGRVVVEYDQGNRHPGNDAAARAFGLLMAQAATDYTTLEVEHTDIWNSDYMPFEAKGYACIGAYEGGENPFYHKTTDVPEGTDSAYLGEVVKAVLATILILAR